MSVQAIAWYALYTISCFDFRIFWFSSSFVKCLLGLAGWLRFLEVYTFTSELSSLDSNLELAINRHPDILPSMCTPSHEWTLKWISYILAWVRVMLGGFRLLFQQSFKARFCNSSTVPAMVKCSLVGMFSTSLRFFLIIYVYIINSFIKCCFICRLSNKWLEVHSKNNAQVLNE